MAKFIVSLLALLFVECSIISIWKWIILCVFFFSNFRSLWSHVLYFWHRCQKAMDKISIMFNQVQYVYFRADYQSVFFCYNWYWFLFLQSHSGGGIDSDVQTSPSGRQHEHVVEGNIHGSIQSEPSSPYWVNKFKVPVIDYNNIKLENSLKISLFHIFKFLTPVSGLLIFLWIKK